jgi:hypothetical protein
MEAEILAAMKRIKFVEAEARRRLLEEEKKKTEAKIPKPMVKKPKDEVPKGASAPKTPIAEAPKRVDISKISKTPEVPKTGASAPKETKESKTPKKQAIPHSIKTLVWNVHIGEKVAEAKCLCCKVTSISIRHFHCGHYVSEKNGGDLSVSNLRPICANCNLSMGAMNMGEFIKKFGLHK